MRVLLDATSGARPDPSGIGRYVHELVRALATLADAPELTLGIRWSRWGGRRHLPSAASGRAHRLRLLVDWLECCRPGSIDVAHGLDARVCSRRRARRVVTLHDVFSQQFSDLADPSFRDRKLRRYRDVAARADRIVCVSEATRGAFLEHFPEAAPRSVVIHHGVADRFVRCSDSEISAVRGRLGLARPYFLFVGLQNSRKNVPLLLKAFGLVAERFTDVELVLAGKPSHGYAEIDAALRETRHRARVQALHFVADHDLPALYSGAVAFVFPSRAEGFGLPVLEAFACGTPVISGDLPVLREIGGVHLCCVPLQGPEAMASKMLERLEHPPSRETRGELVAWARTFTWERCATRHLEQYRALLGE